ncbi:MAG: DUF190 domain-containing protein [Nevskia sp.]|nr:DUF190 domain-containing protein [Nevskia sp.]
MKTLGKCLRFYMHEEYHYAGKPLSEWLVETAKLLKIGGAADFQTQRGFGRHGITHEEHFVGLSADYAPVVVEFFVTDAQAEQLRSIVSQTNINVFVAEWPAQFEQLSKAPSQP